MYKQIDRTKFNSSIDPGYANRRFCSYKSRPKITPTSLSVNELTHWLTIVIMPNPNN